MPPPELDRTRSPRARRLLVTVLAAALGGALILPVTAAQAATTAVPAATNSAVTAATAKPRLLRYGLRGADVKALQRRLVALHYDHGAVNGVFGSDTRNAVVAFQKVNGLSRDGVVGPRTRARMAKPSTPRPRSLRKGVYLEANLTKQVILQFNGKNVTRIVNISSGSGRPYTVEGVTSIARTPRGRFVIQRYIPGWRKSKLGLLWRPMYFTGGFAVHGATSVPAYPASHGCIRTPMATQNRMIASGALKIGRPLYVYG
jgi:lipoprotein-anchoring transpeptidase ErfK/SrfK